MDEVAVRDRVYGFEEIDERGDRKPDEGSVLAEVVLVVLHQRQPVANAQVIWADEVAVERHRTMLAAGAVQQKEAASLAERIRSLGTAVRTDASGQVSIRVRGRHLSVHAEKEGLAGTETFADVAPGMRLEVALAGGSVLRVRVVGDDAEPVADLPLVALWWRSPSGVGVKPVTMPLGTTDAEGRLAFTGWSRTARDAHAMLGETTALVGPAVVGLPERCYAAVSATAAGEEVVLRIPAIATVRCQLVTAAGDPLPWDGLITALQHHSGLIETMVAVADGRSEHLVLPGEPIAWRVYLASAEFGHGTLPLDGTAKGVCELRCDAVGSVRGRVDAALTRCAVSYQSASRGTMRVDLSPVEGRFWFPLAAPDQVRALTFELGQERVVVDVPSPLGPVWDLGYVGGRSEPFAQLRLLGPEGTFTGAVSWAASDAEGASVQVTAEHDGSRFALFAATPAREIRCVGMPRGFAEFSLPLSRGQILDVKLDPIASGRLPVLLPARAPIEHLRLRLRGRWLEREQAWQPILHWFALERGPEGCFAPFHELPASRYQAELWSLAPPCLLAAADVNLDGVDQPPLDARDIRTVQVEVKAGGAGYWVRVVANGAQRTPFCVRQLLSGASSWTVPAATREVVLCAPGRLPQRMSVVADAAEAALPPAGAGPLGLGAGVELVGPIAGEQVPRSVQVYHVERTGVRLELQQGPAWVAAAWWPCDYLVRVEGVERTARWDGQVWRIEE